MARGRVRSRMELREQHEAAEARQREEKGQEDDDLSEIAAPEEAEAEEAEAAPKAKKKKKATEAKPRKKAVKVVRKRVVWVVYDNSNKKVQQFDYTKKADAEALAEKLRTEKKSTYFVQPFKEEITE